MKRGRVLALALVLAGCAADSRIRPGNGWSRAPDLSVYAAMTTFGGIAREQSLLCGGFGTAGVERHWQQDFGAREAAVAARLAQRHGAEAVREAAARAAPTRRVGCPDVPSLRWRQHYARLLRLLEMRLGLA